MHRSSSLCIDNVGSRVCEGVFTVFRPQSQAEVSYVHLVRSRGRVKLMRRIEPLQQNARAPYTTSNFLSVTRVNPYICG